MLNSIHPETGYSVPKQQQGREKGNKGRRKGGREVKKDRKVIIFLVSTSEETRRESKQCVALFTKQPCLFYSWLGQTRSWCFLSFLHHFENRMDPQRGQDVTLQMLTQFSK